MAGKNVCTQEVWFALLKQNGIPLPVPEYQFARSRRWRFDYCWPDIKLALEVEGGIWSGGRHTRGGGFLKDMEKYNEAVVRGWTLLRTTPDRLCSFTLLDLLERVFHAGEVERSAGASALRVSGEGRVVREEVRPRPGRPGSKQGPGNTERGKKRPGPGRGRTHGGTGGDPDRKDEA